MEFDRVRIDDKSLTAYAELMRQCFPSATKFDLEYLRWLYNENPDGQVVGMNAWDGRRLAAHYVCVPTTVHINGSAKKVLLSLNTATHPEFQGKGLFTRLAEMTYDTAANEGFDAVYGVANANSTPGFTRKLGFQLVEPLSAMLGVGDLCIDFETAVRAAQFRRKWSEDGLSWRCKNPKNRVSYHKRGTKLQFFAPAIGGAISAYAELFQENIAHDVTAPKGQPIILSPFRLFIGLVPNSAGAHRCYFNIPQRLRPSPLNFIYRSLSQRVKKLDKGSIALSFLDFDAY